MKKLLVVFLVCIGLLTACSSQSKSAALVGDWKLTAYGPAGSTQPAVPDVEATINFDAQGQVSGNLGCNQFSGKYEVKGSQINFGPQATTLMACPDPQMAQEQAAFKIMSDSADYKIDGNTLTITKDGEVLVFEAISAQ
jgi:heat shock protein HslJ